LRGLGWKTTIHPDDLVAFAEKWESCGSGNDVSECEVRLRRSDGIFRWFSLRRNALRDQLCGAIDARVAPSVTTILLMDAEGKCLWQGGGTRAPNEWMAAVIPVPVAFDSGLCGTAAFLKERVVVHDVATEPNWRDQYRDLAIRNGIRAACSEPILTNDNDVLGTFALYSREARVPSEEDLALIEAAGHIALIAIERQRSQAKLRQDEEELRRIVDLIAQTIVVLSPDGRAIYANRAALEYTGLSLDEVKSDGFRVRVFHPEDIQRLSKERSE
jgi:GAF domain-containing protein